MPLQSFGQNPCSLMLKCSIAVSLHDSTKLNQFMHCSHHHHKLLPSSSMHPKNASWPNLIAIWASAPMIQQNQPCQLPRNWLAPQLWKPKSEHNNHLQRQTNPLLTQLLHSHHLNSHPATYQKLHMLQNPIHDHCLHSCTWMQWTMVPTACRWWYQPIYLPIGVIY